MTSSPIGLVIVEDHEMVRDALVCLFKTLPRFSVLGSAGGVHEALPLLEHLRPDVAVVDLSLQDGSGTGLARVVRQRRLGTRVVILTGYEDAFAAAEAKRAGVSGYVLKTRPTSELMEAIERAMSLPAALPSPDDDDAADPTGAHSTVGLSGLSPRECEVFRLIVAGSSSRQIATNLGISLKTVETHRSSINRKLSVNRPSDLLRFAVAQGIRVAPQSKMG